MSVMRAEMVGLVAFIFSLRIICGFSRGYLSALRPRLGNFESEMPPALKFRLKWVCTPATAAAAA